MNNLPAIFYTWFPVQNGSYYNIYCNINHAYALGQNARMIKKTAFYDTFGPIERYLEAEQEFKAQPLSKLKIKELEEALITLHLNPKKDSEAFYPLEKRLGMPPKEELWVPTERFFWDYPLINLGSSRHILLKNLQLKGSGRNPLATRPDYVHAWGGQGLWQNFKAITFSKTYEAVLPLGLLSSHAIAMEKSEKENLDATFCNSILYREARSFRLTQIMTEFDPYSNPPKSYYQERAQEELKKKNVHFPDSYLFHYGIMLATGIQAQNITKENVMLDGSIIDYEDASYEGDDSLQNFKVTLFVRKSLGDKPSLEDLEGAELMTSSLHHYFSAISLTEKAYQRFLSIENKLDLKLRYLSFLGRIDQEIYTNDPKLMELIQILSSMEGSYKEGIQYYHLPGSPADGLIDSLKKLNTEIAGLSEISPDYTMVDIVVRFPRGKWKKDSLQRYYQSIKKSTVSKLALFALKTYNMLGLDKKEIHFEDCLKFSAMVDENLSRNAWIAPYRFLDDKFEFHSVSLKEINSLITPGCDLIDFELKSFLITEISSSSVQTKELNFIQLEESLRNGNECILKGYFCHIEEIHNHYVALKPVFISAV